MMYLKYTLILFSLVVVFHTTNAQLSEGLPQTTINIEMTPETPGPNEEVYVSLTSYATNLNSSNITWSVNGKQQKSAIGEKTFKFLSGDFGSITKLTIIILTREGEKIEKNISIKPTSVDLIWESDATIPPFYRGKTLFVHQNRITVTAIPHITTAGQTEISPKNLIYTWKKNGSVIEGASGYGKSSYSYISPLISRPATITVDVSNLDNSDMGFSSINLSPSSPLIMFYKKNPITGIEFQRALSGNINLVDSKEIIVVGVPLFFGKSGLSYKWLINGIPTNNNLEKNTQVFRQESETSGVSQIGLSVESRSKILQYASGSFNLQFGDQTY